MGREPAQKKIHSRKAYIRYLLRPIGDRLYLGEVEDTEYNFRYTVVVYCTQDNICYEISPN